MKSPLVSIVIPSYNHEKYIAESIRAAIAQTYHNIELLVIDDGSTDLTWQKLCKLKEECERRFVRTVFMRQSNKGTSLTLRTLCSMAQGEFISPCASDDRYKSSTALERMASFLAEHPDYGVVVGDDEFIDEDGRICYWNADHSLCYDESRSVYRTFADFLKTRGPFDDTSFGTYASLYLRNYIPNGYMFRKSVFDHLEPLTDKAPLEDWFLMLQFSKYTKFKSFNEVMYSYRWHNSNTVKDTARMRDMEEKTRGYEEEVLSKVLASPPLPLRSDVVDVAARGVLYKKHGISGRCEIYTYRKGLHKIKELMLFSRKVMTWQK